MHTERVGLGSEVLNKNQYVQYPGVPQGMPFNRTHTPSVVVTASKRKTNVTARRINLKGDWQMVSLDFSKEELQSHIDALQAVCDKMESSQEQIKDRPEKVRQLSFI